MKSLKPSLGLTPKKMSTMNVARMAAVSYMLDPQHPVFQYTQLLTNLLARHTRMF